MLCPTTLIAAQLPRALLLHGGAELSGGRLEVDAWSKLWCGEGAGAQSLRAFCRDLQLCRQGEPGGLCSHPVPSTPGFARLRAVLEDPAQGSDCAPAGPILAHSRPLWCARRQSRLYRKLESLQRNPRRAPQGLRTFPMEADRTLSLLSLSGRRSRGSLITVTRTLVRKYLGRNNKPGT